MLTWLKKWFGVDECGHQVRVRTIEFKSDPWRPLYVLEIRGLEGNSWEQLTVNGRYGRYDSALEAAKQYSVEHGAKLCE